MHRSLLRPLVPIGLSSLLLWACANAAPSASPSPSPSQAPTSAPSVGPSGSADLATVYAEINAQVSAIRGLDEKKPIEPTLLSLDELADVLRTTFAEDYPPEQVAADEQLYHGLGLLPADAKLADIYLELLESQVAGLYDPVDDRVYVVSKEGDVGPVEKVYYSHEYDHALQDQQFDLEAIQEGLEDQADRALARQSLVEGDAYVLMTYWLQQNLTPEEIGEVVASGSDPAAQAALARIPEIVQAQILFAALEGTQFVLGMQMAGGWPAVDAAFASPPESTEQIIHAEKYASREAPLEVDLPDDLPSLMGSGWSLVQENTMGEYQTSIWLSAASQAAATDGAAGWGGDRIALVGGPSNAWAIAWHTVWDTEDDAAEFDVTAQQAVADAGGPGQVLPGEGGTTRWVVIGSDDAALQKVAGALGLAG